MLHATQAPDYAGGGTFLVSVQKAEVSPKGEFWSNDKSKFSVLIVSKFGLPSLVIDEHGHGRLFQPKKNRSDYSAAMTYVGKKTFHVGSTPFDQPLSVIVGVYEKALEWIGQTLN